MILFSLQRKNEASLAVNKAYELNSKDAYILFYKGMYLQIEEKYGEALDYIETALDLNPIDDEDWQDVLNKAWEMKGKSLIFVGKVKEGCHCLEKAISLNANNSPAIYLLGMMHLRKGSGIEFNYDKGIQLLQQAADLGQPEAKEWLKKLLR